MPLLRPSSLDPARALDEPLRLALADAEEAQKPTRLSVNLKLYHPSERAYREWRDLSWKVELGDVAKGRRVVLGIDLLLRAMERDGEGTLEMLERAVGKGDQP